MDLRLLTEFSVLAETLSYQKAAERLGISHSTLTKHIQRLEVELGTELLTRTTRCVELSPYGEIYQKHVTQMLKIHEQAVSELRRLHDEEAHVLRMVFLPAPERYGIAELLSGFQKAAPDIRIDLLDSDDPRGVLLENQCHMAIAVERDVDIPEIEKRLYRRDRLAVVLPKDHPLAGMDRVTIEQLRDESFIIHRDYRGNIRSQEELLKELCGRAGFTPDTSQTVNFSSVMVRLVSRGEGIAVMNRLHVPAGISGICVVDLDPEVSFNICLCWRKDRPLSVAAQTFLNYYKSVVG